MACGESNEINSEKIVLCSTAEKKLFYFNRSEKKCSFKLGVGIKKV